MIRISDSGSTYYGPSADRTSNGGYREGDTYVESDTGKLYRRIMQSWLQVAVASEVGDISETIDDRVAALLVEGTGITLAYDDNAGTITITSTATGTGDMEKSVYDLDDDGVVDAAPWAGITDKPLVFPPDTHAHDYAAPDHDHAWADITDPPATYPPSTHTHNYAASNHSHALDVGLGYTATVGDASHLSFVITHNLNFTDLIVQVRQDFPPRAYVQPQIEVTSANTITVTFAIAPALNEYRVQILAIGLAEVPIDANFTQDVTSGIGTAHVHFTDTSAGRVDTWDWNWGDGTTHGNTQNPEHTYAAPGVYTVTLTVNGPTGQDTKTKTSLIIVYTPVVADFTYSPHNGNQILSVDFTDTSTGDADEWLWDFGDNTTSQAHNPSHNYANVGMYTVSLTASGNGGTDTKTIVGAVSVYEAVAAAFTYDPHGGQAPVTVQFTDTSVGTYDTWDWDYGDNTTHGDTQNPSHQYTTVGNYTVVLEVSGPGGTDTETVVNAVVVVAAPTGGYSEEFETTTGTTQIISDGAEGFEGPYVPG